MLNLVYFSNVTNNTHRFVEKLDLSNPTHRIPLRRNDPTPTPTPTDKYILITPTYGLGKNNKDMIPHQVRKFLANPTNQQNIIGVISTGNINFGKDYGLAGNIISHKLKIPYMYRLELAGTTDDVTNVRNGILQLTQQHSTPPEQHLIAEKGVTHP